MEKDIKELAGLINDTAVPVPAASIGVRQPSDETVKIYGNEWTDELLKMVDQGYLLTIDFKGVVKSSAPPGINQAPFKIKLEAGDQVLIIRGPVPAFEAEVWTCTDRKLCLTGPLHCQLDPPGPEVSTCRKITVIDKDSIKHNEVLL